MLLEAGEVDCTGRGLSFITGAIAPPLDICMAQWLSHCSPQMRREEQGIHKGPRVRHTRGTVFIPLVSTHEKSSAPKGPLSLGGGGGAADTAC